MLIRGTWRVSLTLRKYNISAFFFKNINIHIGDEKQVQNRIPCPALVPQGECTSLKTHFQSTNQGQCSERAPSSVCLQNTHRAKEKAPIHCILYCKRLHIQKVRFDHVVILHLTMFFIIIIFEQYTARQLIFSYLNLVHKGKRAVIRSHEISAVKRMRLLLKTHPSGAGFRLWHVQCHRM